MAYLKHRISEIQSGCVREDDRNEIEKSIEKFQNPLIIHANKGELF